MPVQLLEHVSPKNGDNVHVREALMQRAKSILDPNWSDFGLFEDVSNNGNCVVACVDAVYPANNNFNGFTFTLERSRVAPKKVFNTPKIEIDAAATATRLTEKIT